MKETALTAGLVKKLNQIEHLYCRKRHGGAFSNSDPDIMGTYRGRSFAMEVKMEHGELSDLQAVQLDLYHGVGSITILAAIRNPTRDRIFRVLCPIPGIEGFSWRQYCGPARNWLESKAAGTVADAKIAGKTHSWHDVLNRGLLYKLPWE